MISKNPNSVWSRVYGKTRLRKTFFWTTIIFTTFFVGLVFFQKPLDNATIQIAKIDFSEEICPEEASLLIQRLKKVKGVKVAMYFKEGNSLVTTFDNRFLNTSNVESIVATSFPDISRAILGKDFPNASGCPIHKSRILSYIFNLF